MYISAHLMYVAILSWSEASHLIVTSINQGTFVDEVRSIHLMMKVHMKSYAVTYVIHINCNLTKYKVMLLKTTTYNLCQKEDKMRTHCKLPVLCMWKVITKHATVNTSFKPYQKNYLVC